MDLGLEFVFSEGFFKSFSGLKGPGSDAAGRHANVDFGQRHILESNPVFFSRFMDGAKFLIDNLMTVRIHLFAFFLFPPSLLAVESAREVLRPYWAPYAREPFHR